MYPRKYFTLNIFINEIFSIKILELQYIYIYIYIYIIYKNNLNYITKYKEK